MGDGSSLELAQEFAVMARRLLSQGTVQQTLDEIVRLATQIVDGCELAGVMLLHGGGRVEVPAATSELVEKCDRLQVEVGEGPCFDAMRGVETYRVDDTGAETRWPEFAPKAAQLGIGSMLGFQLFTGADTLGALNLYARSAHAFSDRSEQVGWLVASHAAVSLAGTRYGAQMREALGTRETIGKAVGVLMERHRLTSEQAFQMLRQVSQDFNLKLREVAARVTETGEDPSQKPG